MARVRSRSGSFRRKYGADRQHDGIVKPKEDPVASTMVMATSRSTPNSTSNPSSDTSTTAGPNKACKGSRDKIARRVWIKAHCQKERPDPNANTHRYRARAAIIHIKTEQEKAIARRRRSPAALNPESRSLMW